MSDYTDKILALLAKAESTTFPAEAEAFLAKAQELMTRHSIDEAMLAAKGGRPDNLTNHSFTIEAPYATAKVQLLYNIVLANSCKAVRTGRGQTQTMVVVGHESDIANIETLYVALSAHAVRSMITADAPDRHVKAFRHSFLMGYAARIGQRLEAAKRTATANYETETGTSTALVLVDRTRAVNDLFKESFPRTTTGCTSSSSGSGHRAGSAAANRADLGQSRIGNSRQALG